jgi:hypothetical protein
MRLLSCLTAWFTDIHSWNFTPEGSLDDDKDVRWASLPKMGPLVALRMSSVLVVFRHGEWSE